MVELALGGGLGDGRKKIDLLRILRRREGERSRRDLGGQVPLGVLVDQVGSGRCDVQLVTCELEHRL